MGVVEVAKMSNKLLERYNRLINLRGAVAATLLPINSDGSINYETFIAYTDHLIDIGVRGIYINGTNGEGLSLSSDERKAVTKSWVHAIKAKKSDMLIISCVSSTVASESIENARYYESIGVDAIAVLPPIYHRPDSIDCLIKYLQSITEAAPDLPLLFYHYPDKSSVNFDLRKFFEEARTRVPNLAGMKYTCNDMAAISSLGSEIRSQFKLFTGPLDCMLPMASMNVTAGISGAFNLRDAAAKYEALLGKLPCDLQAAAVLQDDLNQIQKNLSKGNSIYQVKKAVTAETQGIINLGKPRHPIYVYEDLIVQ